MTVVGWCCLTHTGNEVSSCWKSGGRAAKSLCGCSAVFSGIVCELPVDFRWPVNTWLRVGVLEARDSGAVGVAWPSLIPRPSKNGKRAWYTLSTHALDF